jgi:hypothetical protein
MIDQGVNYIHNNFVELGIVTTPEHYLFSSAVNYTGLPETLIDVIIIEKNNGTSDLWRFAGANTCARAGFWLETAWMTDQKVDFIHDNPVEAGIINEAHVWRLSSTNPCGPVKVLEM